MDGYALRHISSQKADRFSYVVYQGSLVEVESGLTGKGVYSNKSASEAINWALINSPPFTTVFCKGSLTVSSTINVPKNVSLMFEQLLLDPSADVKTSVISVKDNVGPTQGGPTEVFYYWNGVLYDYDDAYCSSVIGKQIRVYVPSYVGPAVLIENIFSLVMDIQSIVYYPSTSSGIGVELRATQQEGILGCKIRIGYVAHFDIDMLLYTEGSGWINANFFEVFTDNAKTVDFKAYNNGDGLGGNIFLSLWNSTTQGTGTRTSFTSGPAAVFPHVTWNTIIDYRPWDMFGGETDYFADHTVEYMRFIGGFINYSQCNDSGVGTKFIGTVDVAGKIFQNSGTSVGTGVQQTIAHGLPATPDTVILSEYNTGGAGAYQSAPADATNIFITAVFGKSYLWKASFRSL